MSTPSAAPGAEDVPAEPTIDAPMDAPAESTADVPMDAPAEQSDAPMEARHSDASA